MSTLLKRYAAYLLLAVWLVTLVAAWRAGARDVQRDWDLSTARDTARVAQAVAGAEKRARDAEYAAAIRVAALETRYQENQNREIADRDRAIAELRAGQRRLFVAIRSAGTGTAGAAGAPGASAGVEEARAELSPAAGEFFIRLGSEADAAVNDLNYCIDRLSVAEGR